MDTDRQNQPAIASTQPAERVGAGKAEKSHSGPKKATRISKKRKSRNALYRCAAEFKHRHPAATAKEAWQHFCTVAEIGGHEVVARYDADGDVLEYFPDADRRNAKTVSRRGFEQQFYHL